MTGPYGDSRDRDNDDGQVVVKWQGAAGTPRYELRYRKMEDDHSTIGWAPRGARTIADWTTESPVTPPDHTVPGLEQGAIYAFQLNYTVGDRKFFSAREAYAWPSDGFPGNAERVATYTFFGHWPDREYRYTLCRDGFPQDKLNQWADLFSHAFRQWEDTTDELVTITHETTVECPTTPFDEFVQRDDDRSEIRMLDPGLTPSTALLLPEVKSDIFKICILKADACTTSYKGYAPLVTTDAATRASRARLISDHLDGNLSLAELSGRFLLLLSSQRQPGNELQSVDITFSRSGFNEYFMGAMNRKEAAIPGRDRRPSDDDIRLNRCFDRVRGVYVQDDSGFKPYRTAVHEMGHALGLSNIDLFPLDNLQTQPYSAAHPSIPDSVMNYDSRVNSPEPDCAPYPFDVMAVTALYQTRDIVPSAPKNLEAVGRPDSVTLTWDPPDKGNIKGYRVYRQRALFTRRETLVELTSDTSYTDRDVVANRAYSYIVRAVDRKGFTLGEDASVTNVLTVAP